MGWGCAYVGNGANAAVVRAAALVAGVGDEGWVGYGALREEEGKG